MAYRNTGYYPIFGVKFHPHDDSRFFTCGYQHLAEWKLSGLHLTCLKFTNVYKVEGEEAVADMLANAEEMAEKAKQRSILLCMDFISYRLGHSVQSDLLFGSNLGDISTYSSKKYTVLRR